MVSLHGDARDLLRSGAIALDWRKCWLGALAVAAFAFAPASAPRDEAPRKA